MTLSKRKMLSLGAAFFFALLDARAVEAEYLRIQLKVYGLDCGICARGVSASVGRLAGVTSVSVSLKTGLLDIALAPGNSFKLSDLRKRIQQNGFRSMESKVTAIGRFVGPKFEVSGAGESYDLEQGTNGSGVVEMIFDVR
jgi:copper chaperone CopZ